ncbi:SCO5918 family protein [Streptomyces diacarni]|uniref:SCO5918 family protein n=1 Tax=Streptomyces diacarni TaxID=2800381 RepID=UPI0033DA67C7
MRCVIAHSPFYLFKNDVLRAMKGVTPEPVSGASSTIGRRTYPVTQVGEVITGQDRRDFAPGEISRALTRLGFTCHHPVAPEPSTPLQTATALLGPLPGALPE